MDSSNTNKTYRKNPSGIIAWFDESRPTWPGIVCGILAFLIPLLLYIITAMREPSDRGDYAKWAFIGKIWGVPHPTGFPLYIFLSALMSRIEIGTLIFRVTLISTVAVSIGMHLLFRIGRMLGYGSLLALAVALLASTGQIVWEQALTPDAYGLHIFLILAQVWALLRWDKSDDNRWMWLATWLFILGLANHPTMLLILPGLFIFTIVRKPRIYLNWRTWIHVIGASLITVGLYSYILIRSSQQHLWNEGLFDGPLMGDLHRFWLYVTASDFSEQFEMIRDEPQVRLWAFYKSGTMVLGRFGWLLVIPGILLFAFRKWRRFLLVILVSAGIFSCNFLFVTSEMISWFAPCFPFMALLAGYPVHWLASIPGRRNGQPHNERTRSALKTASIVSGLASIIILVVAISHIPAYLPDVDKSFPSKEYRSARRMANAIEAPALIMPHDYDSAMRIMYCFYEDDSRRAEWPQYFGLTEDVDLSQGTLSPIIMKWPWDEDLVNQALENGMHVYVMGPGIVVAHLTCWLKPVDTGSDNPEMAEIISGYEPGAIAPEQ